VWSPEFSFRSVGDGKEVMRIALYGDLGLVNSQSMEGLSNEVQKQTIDMAVSGNSSSRRSTGAGCLIGLVTLVPTLIVPFSPLARFMLATGRTTWTSWKA